MPSESDSDSYSDVSSVRPRYDAERVLESLNYTNHPCEAGNRVHMDGIDHITLLNHLPLDHHLDLDTEILDNSAPPNPHEDALKKYVVLGTPWKMPQPGRIPLDDGFECFKDNSTFEDSDIHSGSSKGLSNMINQSSKSLGKRISSTVTAQRPVPANLPHFPLEVWANILPHVDVSTLMAFRRVSRAARQAVSFLPEYDLVYKFFPAGLRVLLATGAGNWTTLHQLHALISTPDCYHCITYHNHPQHVSLDPHGHGTYGQYLCLLKPVQRVCKYHLINAPEYTPIAYRQAQMKLPNLPNNPEKVMPIFKSVPHISHYDDEWTYISQPLVQISDLESYGWRFGGIMRGGQPTMTIWNEDESYSTDSSSSDEEEEDERVLWYEIVKKRNSPYLGRLYWIESEPVNCPATTRIKMMTGIRAPFVHLENAKVDGKLVKGVKIEWGWKCPWCWHRLFTSYYSQHAYKAHYLVCKGAVRTEEIDALFGVTASDTVEGEVVEQDVEEDDEDEEDESVEG